eukprot:Platyproteum_vivax@DN8379_c0_g1_i1.p1
MKTLAMLDEESSDSDNKSEKKEKTLAEIDEESSSSTSSAESVPDFQPAEVKLDLHEKEGGDIEVNGSVVSSKFNEKHFEILEKISRLNNPVVQKEMTKWLKEKKLLDPIAFKCTELVLRIRVLLDVSPHFSLTVRQFVKELFQDALTDHLASLYLLEADNIWQQLHLDDAAAPPIPTD